VSREQRHSTSRLRTGAVVFLLAALFWPGVVRGEERPIDVAHSTMTVRVFKSGLFSLFAHNHEIEAPIAEGRVELAEPAAVRLRVDARRLRVADSGIKEEERAKIQKTMEGPEVLDSARFPEIVFQSTTVEQKGADRWLVHGNLTLHGQTHPVAVEVRREGERYRGTARIKQREFGITPVSIAGGTVKVKDEVKIEFAVALAP
jgi:polyisoprenoid-binding protein YceI